MEQDSCAIRILRVGDSTRDEGRVSALRRFTWSEAIAGGQFRLNAVDTEGPPMVGAACARGEEPMRFYGAVAGLVIASDVVKAQNVMITASARDDGEHVQVDGGPGMGQGKDESVQRRTPALQPASR